MSASLAATSPSAQPRSLRLLSTDDADADGARIAALLDRLARRKVERAMRHADSEVAARVTAVLTAPKFGHFKAAPVMSRTNDVLNPSL